MEKLKSATTKTNSRYLYLPFHAIKCRYCSEYNYGMHFYYISNEFINYYNEFRNGRPRAPDMHDPEITTMVGQIFI